MNKTSSNQRALAESLLNVFIGFGIGIALNFWLLPPLLGVEYSAMTWDLAVYISVIYGGAGLIRSFILRKAFSKYVSRRWTIW
jgi:ABC-type antimicrobial peptide transport system permease subunit